MKIVTKEERAKVEALAERELRSLSGTVRMLMLKGLAQDTTTEAVH